MSAVAPPTPALGKLACWCGAGGRSAFSADYERCTSCGTLIRARPIDVRDYAAVGDDESGFYGWRYWSEHVPRVSMLPSLAERARNDLFERAIFHLFRVLEHRAPSGRLLEIGCGHGGLTRLLAVAGFAAEGLEMSPEVIRFAERTFGIEVHRGPLASAALEPGYAALVAIDVLEHVPDPGAEVRGWREHLAEDGVLFIQTPCHRGEGEDWEMLRPEEHLFLFNEGGLRRLLQSSGFAAVEVSTSLFPYDAWVVAAPRELRRRPAEARGEVDPLLRALADARLAIRAGQRQLEEVDRDRRRKDEVIAALTDDLAAVRSDQAAKEERIVALGRLLDDSRRTVADLEARYGAASADQEAKERTIVALDGQLEELRSDQRAKQELTSRLAGELEEVRADQRAKEELVARLARELEEVRADQRAKEELIVRLDRELRTAAAEPTGRHEDREPDTGAVPEST